MWPVVILLLCQVIPSQPACLDSDILYVRKLDAPIQATWKAYQVLVNASDVIGVIKPFWKSTGFCPPEPHHNPEFFLGDDMQQNLIYIASVPGYGTTQVRMHWLLDLVNATGPVDSERGGSIQAFNFSLLDTLLDRLRALGLRPGLELMGNPFSRPLDFEQPADLALWKELVGELGRHYIERYGEEYVTQWNFESWNEPDHEGYGSNFTDQGLCNYYDACSEGLREANPGLRLGGPAENLASNHRSPMAWALLDHCERSGAHLDFISIHQKGNASTEGIIEGELDALSRIRERCPSLSSKPCINNEADPIKNWAEPLPWRADATYAAMLARLVHAHLEEASSCGSLSSDNGFLSYPPQPFSQRSQLARFRMNLTEPPYVLFVRKPVHALQALLGKLASRAVAASVHMEGEPGGPRLGVIATSSGSQSLSTLLYHSNESVWEPGVEAKVSLRAQLDWRSGSSWAVFQIDNYLSNPYAAWVRQGCPPFPSALQMDQLRANEEPRLVAFGTSGAGQELALELSLPLPSAALVLACGSKGAMAAAPRDVRLHRVSRNRTLVHWRQPRDGCTRGYRLLFSPSAAGPYGPLSELSPLLPLQLVDCELSPSAAACRGPGFVRVHALALGGGRSALSRPVPWPVP